MKRISFRISPKKISDFLRKYHYWILGVIFGLLLVFNIFIYYNHVYLTVNIRVEPGDEEIAVDEYVLDKVMGNISEREDNLDRIKANTYYNPFK